MNINDSIKKALNKIQEVFPKTTVSYQYKSISDTHFIHVLPAKIYESAAFIDLEFALLEEFEKCNVGGSFCFITVDSLVELDNPSIVLVPKIKETSNSYRAFFEISGATVSPQISNQTIEMVQLHSDYPTIIDAGNKKTAMAA